VGSVAGVLAGTSVAGDRLLVGNSGATLATRKGISPDNVARSADHRGRDLRSGESASQRETGRRASLRSRVQPELERELVELRGVNGDSHLKGGRGRAGGNHSGRNGKSQNEGNEGTTLGDESEGSKPKGHKNADATKLTGSIRGRRRGTLHSHGTRHGCGLEALVLLIVKAEGASAVSNIEEALDIDHPSRVNDDGPVRNI